MAVVVVYVLQHYDEEAIVESIQCGAAWRREALPLPVDGVVTES